MTDPSKYYSCEELALAKSEAGSKPEKLSLGERLKRYGKRKSLQEEIAFALGNLGDPEAARLASKMATCGNWLKFRDYYTIEEVRLTGACFCKKHTVCPLCAVRRSARFLESALPKIEYLIESSDIPVYPHLVVFTVKSGFDCSERFRHANSLWRKLLARKKSPVFYPNTFLRYVVGGIVSFEVTRNDDNGWHWHFNVLCLSPQKSFHWASVKKEVFEITGDSIVVNFSEDTYRLVNTLAETVKYITKMDDLTPEQLLEVHNTVSGHRTVRGFGKLYNLKVPSKLTDDVLPEELPFIEYVCRYMGEGGYSIYQALRSAALPPAQPSPLSPEEKRRFRRLAESGALKGR